MDTKNRWWLVVRVVLVAAGALGGPSFYDEMHAEFDTQPFAWRDVLLLFSAVSLGMLFVFGIQAFNPRSDQVWELPRWNSNPFRLKQPLQFFHMAGWHFVALGLSVAFYTFGVVRSPSPTFALPLILGFGVLIGTRFSALVFRHKFVDAGQNPA